MENNDLLTTGQTAKLLGTDEWRIRRLFESGELPEPQKFEGKCMVRRHMLPAIIEALRSRRWLTDQELAT